MSGELASLTPYVVLITLNILGALFSAALVFVVARMYSEIQHLRAEIVVLRSQVGNAGITITRVERQNIALEQLVIDLRNQLIVARAAGDAPPDSPA